MALFYGIQLRTGCFCNMGACQRQLRLSSQHVINNYQVVHRNQLLAWIHNFLCDRKQGVCVNGEFLTWSEVLIGIPQGSILGPLLFLIYIQSSGFVHPTRCQY